MRVLAESARRIRDVLPHKTGRESQVFSELKAVEKERWKKTLLE